MQDADRIRDHILRGIADGTFRPGDRLPTERSLSTALAVGRGALRDALAVLQSEGRIERRRGSGTYVTDARSKPSPGQISPADVMAARLVLEPPLAHLVATQATLDDFLLMEHCLCKGAQASALAEFELWDGAFHRAIVRAARNPLIDRAYDLVMDARDQDDWGALKMRSLTPARRAAYQADHEAIFAALKRRDGPAGEAAIRAHLLSVRNNLLDP